MAKSNIYMLDVFSMIIIKKLNYRVFEKFKKKIFVSHSKYLFTPQNYPFFQLISNNKKAASSIMF